MAIQIGRKKKVSTPRSWEVFGKFPLDVAGVAATRSWNFDGASPATFTYASTGTTGNSFHTQIVDLTGTQNTNAITDPSGTGNIDCVIYCMDETAVNPAISFFNHGISGGGVSIYETTTQLVIMYEGSVSTLAQVKTAINASTYWRAVGGTAANVLDTTSTDECINVSVTGTALNAWLSEDQSTGTHPALRCKVNLSTATLAEMKAVINFSYTQLVSLASAQPDSTVCTTLLADAHLSGGVAAVALSSTLTKGAGFSVSRASLSGSGDGTGTDTSYDVTLDDYVGNADLHHVSTCYQPGSSASPVEIQPISFTASTKILKLVPYDINADAVVDPGYASGRFIHFGVKFTNRS